MERGSRRNRLEAYTSGVEDERLQVRPVDGTTRMSDASFLQAIQSAPGDTGLLLAYADWLEERGDTRAEFIRVSVALGEWSPNEARFQPFWSQLRRLRSGIDPAWLAMLDRTPVFAPLQAAIARKNREDGYDASHPWFHELTVNQSADLLDVEYRGEYELW